MLEQILGVSPPQARDDLGAKGSLKKDLNGTSEKDYKNEFEANLKQKLDAPEDSNIQKKNTREDLSSSGGNKQKMNLKSENDILISKNMDSEESVIEIPGSTKELALEDVKSPNQLVSKNDDDVETVLQDMQPQLFGMTLASPQVQPSLALNNLSDPAVTSGLALQKSSLPVNAMSLGPSSSLQPTLQKAQLSEPSALEGTGLLSAPTSLVEDPLLKLTDGVLVQGPVMYKLPIAEQMNTQSLATDASPTEFANHEVPSISTLSFEDKLKHEVDFNQHILGEGIAAPIDETLMPQKKKLFETSKDFLLTGAIASKEVNSEKDLALQKAKVFEQNVFEQLQKSNSFAKPLGANQVANQTDLSSATETFLVNPKASEADNFSFKNEKLSEPIEKAFSKQDELSLGASDSLKAGHTESKLAPQSAGQALQTTSVGRFDEDHHKNIENVMNQAKYLVKQGGGEMNVKMSPEGLGDVHLKVMLLDGRVQIEIKTQDRRVQNLVEESLSELKSGLAAHKLNVDHVRIDTVSSTQTDNSSQFHSQNQSHSQQRDMSQGGSGEKGREFWKQFQDNLSNQSGRKGYQEINGATASSAARTESAGDGKNRAAALRTYGGTKGSTVNQVA